MTDKDTTTAAAAATSTTADEAKPTKEVKIAEEPVTIQPAADQADDDTSEESSDDEEGLPPIGQPATAPESVLANAPPAERPVYQVPNTLEPRLRRLNGDTSWLLQVPVAEGDLEYRSNDGKPAKVGPPTRMFNLLIDPWLDASPEVSFLAAFSQQSRTLPAAVDSIGELNELLEAEQEKRIEAGVQKDNRVKEKVDAILISHPFQDHMHPGTLDDPAVAGIPVVTTPAALQTVRSHLMAKEGSPSSGEPSTQVYVLPPLPLSEAPSWDIPPIYGPIFGTAGGPDPKAPIPPLPSSLQVHAVLPKTGLISGRGMSKTLHGGISIRHRASTGVSTKTEQSILYSPHGIHPASLPIWLGHEEGHKTLICSWDPQSLPSIMGGAVNLGLPGIVKLLTPQKGADATFPADLVLSTHDERKEASGVVAKLLKRKVLGLEDLDLIVLPAGLVNLDAKREAKEEKPVLREQKEEKKAEENKEEAKVEAAEAKAEGVEASAAKKEVVIEKEVADGANEGAKEEAKEALKEAKNADASEDKKEAASDAKDAAKEAIKEAVTEAKEAVTEKKEAAVEAKAEKDAKKAEEKEAKLQRKQSAKKDKEAKKDSRRVKKGIKERDLLTLEDGAPLVGDEKRWEATATRVLQHYVATRVAEVDRKHVAARSLDVGEPIVWGKA